MISVWCHLMWFYSHLIWSQPLSYFQLMWSQKRDDFGSLQRNRSGGVKGRT